MKIALVSDKWASSSKNGVSIVATMHAKLIEEIGHDLTIIGPNNKIHNEHLLTKDRFSIQSSGTGSLYSRVKIDRKLIGKILANQSIDLVIVEGWQTALTDTTIQVAYELKIPVMMISHGISLHPFSTHIRDLMRSIFWIYYKLIKFPKLIKMLSGITALDLEVKSKRFYDRDVAAANKKTIYKLVNSPQYLSVKAKDRCDRIPQIVVVGYFSYIKNQLAALRLLKKLDKKIIMKFIGEKEGAYYKKCLRYATKNKLMDRVIFSNDRECSISDEIGKSILALSSSLTEVQPLFLLEAMALGTPFISNNVGAIPKMLGGQCCLNEKEKIERILRLIEDKVEWQHFSTLGIKQVNEEFNMETVKSQITEIINNLMCRKK